MKQYLVTLVDVNDVQFKELFIAQYPEDASRAAEFEYQFCQVVKVDTRDIATNEWFTVYYPSDDEANFEEMNFPAFVDDAYGSLDHFDSEGEFHGF